MSEAIRVAVADDHPMFRAGVVASLREVEGIEIVGEADDAASALALARSELPRRHHPRYRHARKRSLRRPRDRHCLPGHQDRDAHGLRG